MNALVLNDEPDRTFQMREGLLDHGVSSDEASTVGEAIGLLVSSSYDLVVCDMVLDDPPGAANAAFRGYLVVCFALALCGPARVIQASSLRRLVHAGALLTNWSVGEVADLVYGARGIPPHRSLDGGCPWAALERASAAPPARRPAAVAELEHLPILRELEAPLGLDGPLASLEDAAAGRADWHAAVSGFRGILFPGARSAA